MFNYILFSSSSLDKSGSEKTLCLNWGESAKFRFFTGDSFWKSSSCERFVFLIPSKLFAEDYFCSGA